MGFKKYWEHCTLQWIKWCTHQWCIYVPIVVSAVVMLWRGREGGRDGVWDRGRERGMEAREGGKEVGRERARAK